MSSTQRRGASFFPLLCQQYSGVSNMLPTAVSSWARCTRYPLASVSNTLAFRFVSLGDTQRCARATWPAWFQTGRGLCGSQPHLPKQEISDQEKFPSAGWRDFRRKKRASGPAAASRPHKLTLSGFVCPVLSEELGGTLWNSAEGQSEAWVLKWDSPANKYGVNTLTVQDDSNSLQWIYC